MKACIKLVFWYVIISLYLRMVWCPYTGGKKASCIKWSDGHILVSLLLKELNICVELWTDATPLQREANFILHMDWGWKLEMNLVARTFSLLAFKYLEIISKRQVYDSPFAHCKKKSIIKIRYVCRKLLPAP